MMLTKKKAPLFLLAVHLFSFSLLPGVLFGWEQSKLKGGHISSLAVMSSRIFAGSAIGLYMSTDKGNIFQSKILAYDSAGKIDFLRVTAVATDAKAVYAATSKGLYISHDGGNRFQMQKIGDQQMERPFIHTIRVVLLGEISYVFAASSNGIARSATNGKKWDVLMTLEDLGALNSIDVGTDGKIFAAGEKGLFTSTWREGWKPLMIPHSTKVYQILSGANDEIFAVADINNAVCLVASQDGGTTWGAISSENVFKDSILALFKKILYVTGPEGVNSFHLQTGKFDVDRSLQTSAISILALPDESMLLVGTAGQGVWRKQLR